MYCSWGKLVPFTISKSTLLSELFAIMAKKVAPGVTPENYCLVCSTSIKIALPLNQTLEELNIAPKTQFVCKYFI